MKRVLSGVKPSGEMTLGNYLGALRQWVEVSHSMDCFFSVVDLHALTEPQDPKLLRQRTLDIARFFIAAGIDPNKSTIFVQSHVRAHAQLGWLMECVVGMGELNRMVAFKEKSEHKETVSAALFNYPALMAADILLYQTDLVPVGEDQKQHLELTRDLANRFNRVYGETFKVPEPYIPEVGARIMSLQDPHKKMSKSDENPGAYVLLTDAPEVVLKKFKRAVTDSGSEVRFDDENKPAISNLMSIYANCTGKTIAEVEAEFAGKQYGAFKVAVGEAVNSVLAPIQARFVELTDEIMREILRDGAERAAKVANATCAAAEANIGLLQA